MTPERRVEMQLYRELAMAVEARLQGQTRKDSDGECSGVDSGVTMLSGTECASSDHPSCASRRVDSGSVGEIESVILTSEDITSLNTANVKTLVLCSELERGGLKTVTNSDLMSGSDSMLGSFRQDGTYSKSAFLVGSSQQRVDQIDCSEVENSVQHINVSIGDTRDLCLSNNDYAAQNSKTGSVFMEDDIINSDKCCVENTEPNSGFSLTDNIFDSCYTAYKPWENVHGENTSNEGNKVLKQQQEIVIGMNGNKQGLEETVAHSDVNGNLVQSTQWRQINSSIHCCLVDSFITPVTHNVKLKSASFVNGTDDNGQTYGSNNSASEAKGESIHGEAFTSQNQINSKNPLEHVQFQTGVNGTYVLHSYKADETNTPVGNVPCISKDTYSSNISRPVKICEGIMDISDSLRSESCRNEESVGRNASELDRSAVTNICSFSTHSSAGSTWFTGLTYVSSSTPHLLINDNLEDSASSVVMTSSTDLNHYMNTTGSSGSGSPDRDVAALHNCKWSGQDERHSTSNVAALQRYVLSESTFSKQHLQLTSVCDPNSVLHHSFLTDQTEEQKSIQNCDDDEVRTSSNKENYCPAEMVAVRGHPPDGVKVTCPLSTECASSHFNKSCKNVNCHVGNKVKCLNIPKVKLQHKTVDKHDDLETSLSPLNKFAHDSSTTEEHMNIISEWNVPKPETTPPKLVRQNSYTLVAPSPLLVAHMKMQNGKNSVHDMTESSNISTKPRRNASDVGKPRKKWELNRKKGNSSFASLNGNINSGKKINSTTSASSIHDQLHQNSSLPSSNTSSPIKLRTPFASLDCLPSAVSVESVKTFPQPSPRKKNKCVCKNSISSTPSKETKTSQVSQEKSPTKRPRKGLLTENPSLASQGSPKKMNEARTEPLSCQQDVQGLILHLQSQHSQQMADLLAKQRTEQEELREAFLRQQKELMFEVCKVYSATLYTPGSQKQLAQHTPPHDRLTRQENRSFNFSVNQIPSDLSSESLLLENANISGMSTHDMGVKCVLSDTNFERPICNSPSADMGQNVTDSSLYQDSLRDRTQGPNEITPHLQDSSHKDEPMEEVPQNALQDGSSLRLSESGNTERCHPVHSFHPSINESTSTQMLIPPKLGVMHEHNSDHGEENARKIVAILNGNCGDLPLPCDPGVASNGPISETTSKPRTINHSLQRTEAEFPHGSVPSRLFAHERNSVGAKDGQNDSTKGRSPCIRQLFPAHEKPSALHQTARNRCDLEKVRRLFLYVSIISRLHVKEQTTVFAEAPPTYPSFNLFLLFLLSQCSWLSRIIIGGTNRAGIC
jgi:hypothetical protein